MQYTITRLVLAAGAVALVGSTAALHAETRKPAAAPVVITPPAVPDGSNFSRAPFPAARPQNDVTPPNGEAFDQEMPPNTPSTTPEPVAPPAPTVAILQPHHEPGVMPTEPGLMPTGRTTVAASASLNRAQLDPMIRNASFEARDNLVDTVRSRMRQSDATMREFRRTRSEMSAEGRTQFDSEASDVHAKAKALDKSLRAAAKASSADWDSARQQLAADFDAYADALARVDSAVGVSPNR